ncbi:hypothetical protein KSZ_40140 [Dictyobacter formicarum]|uniref:Uncharacterized protein n=1 Tax=Dictyobacter formicarum TaxID=2778368 RepID=A0ABQ3VJK6_9CHLR|nr:hypothetical protein KSZ_40140 [Dictyobacter formicarum]
MVAGYFQTGRPVLAEVLALADVEDKHWARAAAVHSRVAGDVLAYVVAGQSVVDQAVVAEKVALVFDFVAVDENCQESIFPETLDPDPVVVDEGRMPLCHRPVDSDYLTLYILYFRDYSAIG